MSNVFVHILLTLTTALIELGDVLSSQMSQPFPWHALRNVIEGF